MVFSFALTMAFQSLQKPANLEINAPFDKGIFTPEAILGYEIGDRITTYRDQERVYDSLAKQSGGRAKRIDYGMSNNRFPLRVYAISSPQNIARLDAIQKAIAESAQKGVKPASNIPAIVWVNETIHGNEPASFEAGMELAYNLIAGKGEFSKSLDNVVVILNPVYNPDGHERFAVSYNSYARGDYQPGNFEQFEISLLWGRFNHYRFDMNRDRVSFSQKETQAEVALMQKWRPQIYLDQHGQVENYFFPPNPMSINANVDRARLNKWTDILGKACASAFDATGWSYFVREDFDLYYPGYLDSHTALSGAIGITHETDGGKVLAKTRSDGSIVTLREGAAKHMTTALAVIKTAAERKTELLADWTNFKKRAVSGEHAGKFKRVVMSGSYNDLLKIYAQLSLTGVKSKFLFEPFKQMAHDYYSNKIEEVTFPVPSLIVDMAQEYGPIAKTLLEISSDFEPEFLKSQMGKKDTAPDGERYPGPDGTEFYDQTGWALPYAHNVKAWWCEEAITAPTQDLISTSSMMESPNAVGYVFPYIDEDCILSVAKLLRAGVRVSIASADLQVGGQTYPKGSFVIFTARNEDKFTKEQLYRVVSESSAGRRSAPMLLPTSYPDGERREGPGNRLRAIQNPKIGIVFGDGAQIAAVSGIWYTMEQVFHLPFVSLSGSSLTAKVLRDYTCIVVPSGSTALAKTALKDWVRDGGVVVSLGDTSAVTSVFAQLQTTGAETRSLPGSIFRAELDLRSILSSGYSSSVIAVPDSGETFLKAKKEGGAVVKYSPDEKVTKLLTGWSWGEETEKAMRGAVWMHDEPVGSGHAIWFSFDPTERAMWPGLHKLLLNAMILSAGN
jgi:hypothetical protein